MTNTITLDFSINANTSLGEEVFVAGNISQLGDWNTGNAYKLYTSKDLYPEWRNRRPITIPANISLEFKVFTRNPQGVIRWEKVPSNRKLVAIESVLISFSQSRNDITFQSKDSGEEVLSFRKNTFDIIDDLSDEVSQSSSGNQREFWNERRNRVRKSQSTSKEFIADSKIIYESWTTQKPKYKHVAPIHCWWTQGVPSTHYIIKKQDNEFPLINGQTSSSYDKQRKPIGTMMIKHLKVDDKVDRLQILKQHENCLKIFHLEDDSDLSPENTDCWLKKTAKLIKRTQQGFIVIHLNRQQNKTIDEEIINNTNMVITGKKTILKDILNKFHKKSQYSITVVKPNQFIIKKDQHIQLIIIFQPDYRDICGKNDQIQEYFVELESCWFNSSQYFQLPENLRLSILLEKNIIRDVQRKRFCLTLMCQKLQDIHQKILTKLIRVSSYPNININIMTSDEIQQIFKKLPISENDKMLAYNRSGEIFKPGKKHSNIYEELHVSFKKYQEIFAYLKNKASFWVQQREVEIVQTHWSLQFLCEDNAIGEIISDTLFADFGVYDDFKKYPYQIEKFKSDNGKIVVHIRPLLSSTEFYSIIIASINALPPFETYFFNFDFTKDKYRFLEKMSRATSEKKSLSEGFIMGDQSGVKGLKISKLQQFLDTIMNCIMDVDPIEISKPTVGKRDNFRADLVL